MDREKYSFERIFWLLWIKGNVGGMGLPVVTCIQVISAFNCSSHTHMTINKLNSFSYFIYLVLRVWSTVGFFEVPAINDAKSNEGS